MNLEEVKEHFKNAKEVRCLRDGEVYNMNEMTKEAIHLFNHGYWFDIPTIKGVNSCKLWDEGRGFAEIISYKKDAQRIKEDCELLDSLLCQFDGLERYSFNDIFETVLDFKKDIGLIIEPTELDKLKQSYNELIEKAEEIKQQIDNLK